MTDLGMTNLVELHRVPDWVDALFATIACHEAQAFQRGKSDCWCMALDVARAITGIDPFADQRSYTTERGALRMIKRFGVKNLGDGLATRLPEVPVMIARRGDIAVFDEVMAVGVVTGDMVLTKSPLIATSNGMVGRPLISAHRAFRVG
jgi:hypothetical protein